MAVVQKGQLLKHHRLNKLWPIALTGHQIADISCTSFSKVAVEIGDSVVCRFAAGSIGGVLGGCRPK